MNMAGFIIGHWYQLKIAREGIQWEYYLCLGGNCTKRLVNLVRGSERKVSDDSIHEYVDLGNPILDLIAEDKL